MKIALLALSIAVIVSCGEDSGSNRRGGVADKITPGATATDNAGVLSYVHRTRGNPVLTVAEEINNTLKNEYTAAYRFVPLMGKDDEGSYLNTRSVQTLGRPATDCGISSSFSNIDERIADCAAKNSSQATWTGSEYGASGESTWRLVSRDSSTTEVWFDSHTGLVWSDVIAKDNWCKASGNEEPLTGTQAIDCLAEGTGASLCINLNLAGYGGNVKWRLPTRNDYLQADLDGLRFLRKTANDEIDSYWTATMASDPKGTVSRTKAWLYSPAQGTLKSDTLTVAHEIRCIGIPVRK